MKTHYHVNLTSVNYFLSNFKKPHTSSKPKITIMYNKKKYSEQNVLF